MYEFWYDYIKLKYGECRMDTDSFITYIKTEDIYIFIVEDIAARFDSSTYELDKPLPIGKNKKVIGSMKDEIGGKII